MAFEKGHKLATGRPVGSISKKTRTFQETLEAKGFSVAEALLDIHNKGMELYESKGDPQGLKIAGDMVKEIASYYLPKLKSVEHSNKSPLTGMTSVEKLEAMKQAVKMLEKEVEALPADESRLGPPKSTDPNI